MGSVHLWTGTLVYLVYLGTSGDIRQHLETLEDLRTSGDNRGHLGTLADMVILASAGCVPPA